MEEKKWFILANDQVTGPYTPSEISQKESNTEIKTALFWARNKPHWMDIHSFRSELQKDIAEARAHAEAQASRLWKLRDKDVEREPMRYDQLIDYLKTKKDLSQISVWTQGYSDWKDIFQIHNILEELGVSRRQHPRVPIQGIMIIDTAGSRFQGELATISEGGLGLSNGTHLSIGDKVKGVISSNSLQAKINCSAEVVFVGRDGFVGLKFINISTEAKSSIVEYVKRFLQTQGENSQIK